MANPYPTVNLDGTGYLVNGEPTFGRCFLRALSFHSPEALAAVLDDSGAYHINLDGTPRYSRRFIESYGFYQGLATVRDEAGYFHVQPDGEPAYRDRFRWAGNFQDGRCPVLGADGFFHLTPRGLPAYAERYEYVGDFVHRVAVVRANGQAHHIRCDGSRLHARTFIDASVFHKGAAVVHDELGAFHVDVKGRALHDHRFLAAEPFYNGVALCTRHDGRRVRLHENGFFVHLPTAALPIGVDAIVRHVADGARVTLLLRHAERNPIVSGWGNEALLTARGRAQSTRLGAALARAPSISILSSPVERCLETARHVAEGAVVDCPVVITSLLGAPGVFRDPAGGPELSPGTFCDYATNYMEVGRAPGMRPLEVACEDLVVAMTTRTDPGLSVLVSHDVFVAGLARYLGLKYPTREDWADFLEGVCVIQRPGQAPTWRRFEGLRELGAC